MRRWFMQLMEMRWLRLLANKGDDMLLPWKDGSLFDGLAGDHEALLEEFRENEAILSMMVGKACPAAFPPRPSAKRTAG